MKGMPESYHTEYASVKRAVYSGLKNLKNKTKFNLTIVSFDDKMFIHKRIIFVII